MEAMEVDSFVFPDDDVPMGDYESSEDDNDHISITVNENLESFVNIDELSKWPKKYEDLVERVKIFSEAPKEFFDQVKANIQKLETEILQVGFTGLVVKKNKE